MKLTLPDQYFIARKLAGTRAGRYMVELVARKVYRSDGDAAYRMPSAQSVLEGSAGGSDQARSLPQPPSFAKRYREPDAPPPSPSSLKKFRAPGMGSFIDDVVGGLVGVPFLGDLLGGGSKPQAPTIIQAPAPILPAPSSDVLGIPAPFAYASFGLLAFIAALIAVTRASRRSNPRRVSRQRYVVLSRRAA